MPQVVRCQIDLTPGFTPQNKIMNTWHIVTVGATTPADAADAFVADVNTFYQAIDANFSQYLGGNVPFLRAFNLDDPMPRQPVHEESLITLTSASTWLPREIACCLSYKGTYLSGVSPKRKRGRIYLGPLAAATVDTANDGMFTSSFVTAVKNAAAALLTASTASSAYRWCIYSPTSDPNSNNPAGGAGQDAGCWDAVVGGWVDDEIDIQRRRGVGSGTKTLFP